MRIALPRLSPAATHSRAMSPTAARKVMDPAPSIAQAVLADVFGFHQFRSHQAEIIATVLVGGDVLALMPTGGGKSLCYQIPALVRAGTGIVVSPLIALMQDQVDALTRPASRPPSSTRRSTCASRTAIEAPLAAAASTPLRRARAPGAGAHAGTAGAQRHRAVRHRRGALRLAVGPRLPARIPPAQDARRALSRTCRASR